jgi:DNA-binding transcriptional LysR family regulator
MATLDHYRAFVSVVDSGSLTAAARQLGKSLQWVSRLLAELERELGVELVRRTTRKLQATQAGLAFHARMRAALEEIEDARRAATQEADVVSGCLRIAGPAAFSPRYLVPALATFMSRFNGLSVELSVSDRLVDFAHDAIDVAVRIGELAPSSLRARKLSALRRVFYATPAFLSVHGVPTRPSDLLDLPCVLRSAAPEADGWPATVGAEQIKVGVAGGFRSDSAEACNEAVLAGLGVGIGPLWQVRDLVDQGRLVLVLTGHEPPPVPIHAVWPPAAAMPARVRLFVDFAAARFGSERW